MWYILIDLAKFDATIICCPKTLTYLRHLAHFPIITSFKCDKPNNGGISPIGSFDCTNIEIETDDCFSCKLVECDSLNVCYSVAWSSLSSVSRWGRVLSSFTNYVRRPVFCITTLSKVFWNDSCFVIYRVCQYFIDSGQDYWLSFIITFACLLFVDCVCITLTVARIID